MIKLADTQTLYSTDPYALAQFDALFGPTEELNAEFDAIWHRMLPQAIAAHAHTGLGEYAGSGCVDYNEAKTLYLFTRRIQPKIMFELGYAAGVSSAFIGLALSQNGFGQLHTVDLSPSLVQCDEFKRLRDRGTIVQHAGTDAVAFLESTDLTPDLTFSDASHEYALSYAIASVLKRRWPTIIHLYHEWSMSRRAGAEEIKYVSMTHAIGNLWERDAMEDVFGPEFRHGGLVGSCGMGIVMPI